jgi:predicted nucleic-acid-binding protein
MIGLDTNVLARYLVRDDPGFINRIVLCELVWVLESAYGYSKDTIVAVLEKLLRTSQLKISNCSNPHYSWALLL